MRVAIVGAPGTGKTTVAADVMAELREKGIAAELVSEFAREFIVANGGISRPHEQVFMAREQKRREDTLAERSDLVIISDSPYIMNFIYASLLASGQNFFDPTKTNPLRDKKRSGSRLMMELVYKDFLDALRDYDVIAYAAKPTGPVKHEDGVRIHDEQMSEQIDRMIKAMIDMHGGPDVILKGSRSNRRDTLVEYIVGSRNELTLKEE